MLDETTTFPAALDWTSLSALADQVSAVVHQAEAALALEQAVHGLDTMSEVALQTVLQKGLAHCYAVTREVHYPSSSGAKRSSRQRCDLVLSPRGTQLLPESNEQLSLHLLDTASAPRMYAPEESFWLEVKVAYQLRAGGLQHKGYSGQFRQAVVADLRKLTAEPLIRHAALLLIVFNESAEIASQDLELFEALFFPKQELSGSRQVRSLRIQDRLGHRLCTTTLWPIGKVRR